MVRIAILHAASDRETAEALARALAALDPALEAEPWAEEAEAPPAEIDLVLVLAPASADRDRVLERIALAMETEGARVALAGLDRTRLQRALRWRVMFVFAAVVQPKRREWDSGAAFRAPDFDAEGLAELKAELIPDAAPAGTWGTGEAEPDPTPQDWLNPTNPAAGVDWGGVVLDPWSSASSGNLSDDMLDDLPEEETSDDPPDRRPAPTAASDDIVTISDPWSAAAEAGFPETDAAILEEDAVETGEVATAAFSDGMDAVLPDALVLDATEMPSVLGPFEFDGYLPEPQQADAFAAPAPRRIEDDGAAVADAFADPFVAPEPEPVIEAPSETEEVPERATIEELLVARGAFEASEPAEAIVADIGSAVSLNLPDAPASEAAAASVPARPADPPADMDEPLDDMGPAELESAASASDTPEPLPDPAELVSPAAETLPPAEPAPRTDAPLVRPFRAPPALKPLPPLSSQPAAQLPIRPPQDDRTVLGGPLAVPRPAVPRAPAERQEQRADHTIFGGPLAVDPGQRPDAEQPVSSDLPSPAPVREDGDDIPAFLRRERPDAAAASAPAAPSPAPADRTVISESVAGRLRPAYGGAAIGGPLAAPPPPLSGSPGGWTGLPPLPTRPMERAAPPSESPFGPAAESPNEAYPSREESLASAPSPMQARRRSRAPLWIGVGIAALAAGLGVAWALGALDGLAAGLGGMLGAATLPPGAAPVEAEVDMSAFAPAAAQRGTTVLVQVLLHLPEASDVAAAALAADPGATLKGHRSLLLPLSPGDRVDIAIEVPGCVVEDAHERIVWRARTEAVAFPVAVPAGFAGAAAPVTLRAFRNGEPLGRIAFALPVSESAEDRAPRPAGDSARRYRHAFVSYASPDRPTVVRYAHAWSVMRQSYFQDVLSLEAGDEWEPRLFSEIEKSDVFLLFWSQAASRSEYVRREAEYALARRRAGQEIDILPVVIDGPPPPPAPETLSAIHFNDRAAYVVAAVMREAAGRT